MHSAIKTNPATNSLQEIACLSRKRRATMVCMDPKYTGEGIMALGRTADASNLSFPGTGSGGRSGDESLSSFPLFPKVTEHLVKPEVSREEVIRGRKIVTMGANPEHAKAHTRADFLLAPHVIDTYDTASDMLTRVNQGSNFATDVAVFKKGIDPATGVRYLEELSFEVVNEQSASEVQEKAEDLVRRGVRRVFGIFVKKGYVAEWSREKQDWEILPANVALTDTLFIRPIPASALLDAAAAEIEVAKALWQKENPALKKIAEEAHKEGHKEGQLDGQREMLLEQLADKFGNLSPAIVERVETASRLEIQALSKAVLHANTLDDVFAITIASAD